MASLVALPCPPHTLSTPHSLHGLAHRPTAPPPYTHFPPHTHCARGRVCTSADDNAEVIEAARDLLVVARFVMAVAPSGRGRWRGGCDGCGVWGVAPSPH
eukprot:21217-Chlamydomonas_euryale.AAC.1